jgi:predicted metal-dependent hydrolase
MTLDWQSGALAEGLACYCKREYFLAHEHWESVWLQLNDPEKSFLQALIQITAAFHHLQTGNTTGALSLLRRAMRRLELAPESFAGIAVAPLRAEIGALLEAHEKAEPFTIAIPQIRPASPR